MFEIDKKKFGTFVSERRKEQGYTQKELARKLYISDKAVSKWETGGSIPDTALLIPLSELLGVTVTELLLCERMEKEAPIGTEEVETIVKTAITYAGEKPERAYETKNKWPVIYLCSLAVGIIGILYSYAHGLSGNTMLTAVILAGVFGAYFCIFVKTSLPEFYDKNRCGLYYDGPFRMNLPGVVFNNSNWPYIVRVCRIWSCACAALYPIVNIGMNRLFPDRWQFMELCVCLVLTLGGLLVPVYVVGKKYE